jgi:tetratricopeptide (TPR) repeat protein
MEGWRILVENRINPSTTYEISVRAGYRSTRLPAALNALAFWSDGWVRRTEWKSWILPRWPDPARPAGGNIKVVPDEAGEGEGSAASPVAVADDPDRKPDGKKPGARPVRRPPGPAADERDPKALLRQGKQHEKNSDWEAARAVYQKLEKIKGYAGVALYQQAWVAIQTNELDVAIQLASRSAGQPGSHKTDAKFLYGDALYKQGEFRRAKDIYIGLRKGLAGEMKATATRKIAAANRALKLPEDDGIDD